MSFLRRMSLFVLALFALPAPAQQSAPLKPLKSFDLNGEWQADFTVNNSLTQFKREQVMIQHLGDSLVATKITGDEFVPAGKVTVRATLSAKLISANPFTAEQVCAASGYVNPQWLQITVTVLDASHFKVAGGCSGNVTWERVGKPTLALDSAILFDVDKSALKPEAQATLEKIVQLLAEKHPRSRLLIAGYTDDTGGDAHNLQLSTRRAQSVAAWLLQHDVAKPRLRTEGFGKRNPRYPNTNDEARSHNRRVEIVILD